MEKNSLLFHLMLKRQIITIIARKCSATKYKFLVNNVIFSCIHAVNTLRSTFDRVQFSKVNKVPTRNFDNGQAFSSWLHSMKTTCLLTFYYI
jgi:hypothetical protein